MFTGNFGGAFASNIYRTKDAPRYIVGRECSRSVYIVVEVSSRICVCADAIELMFVGIGFIFLPIVVILYKRINSKRERMMNADGRPAYSEQELKEMGDKAPDFRYTI
jgi:hypothetical protein